ncbi:YsnF/AvaK domain-containing protein [Massilia niabensis]|uniref:YsnF/AvaK domain-containing protein n=1 Tax=Massilia niabensis TaxID=544910 RepID=A0ABW0LAP7_9BURK
MSRTITALFDTRADAEAGRQRLLDAHLDADHVRIHDKSSIGTTGYSSPTEPGMWASIRNAFLPDEDRHIYEEGVRRGGFLLTADVGGHQVDDAIQALDNAQFPSVDIDERANQWKSEGWVPPTAGAAMAGTTARSVGERDTRTTGTAGDGQRLQVVEEQLIVGKREVERGGVRVRSYVTEQPVHEQIRLRSERIKVERHPVDRAVDDDAFRERSIEMTQTEEEAVVDKSARIVEEVVVTKTSEERVEQINETVRHTEVVVEKLDDKPGR